MSVSTTFASLATLDAVVTPIVPVASFKLGPSYEPRNAAKLVADLYVSQSGPGYTSAIWSALEGAGVVYRGPGAVKLLVKIYAAGCRVNQYMAGGVLARIPAESISEWLDRIEMHSDVRGIGVEVLASEITKDQVRCLFTTLAPCKRDPAGTASLVAMHTFIAPPSLAPEVKQFVCTAPAIAPIEHREAVELPKLKVPAGHVEPAAPLPEQHVESVGDAFPAEGQATGVVMTIAEEIALRNEVVIMEEEILEARTVRELGRIWKAEFGFAAPSKIRKEDLIILISAKRVVAD